MIDVYTPLGLQEVCCAVEWVSSVYILVAVVSKIFCPQSHSGPRLSETIMQTSATADPQPSSSSSSSDSKIASRKSVLVSKVQFKYLLNIELELIFQIQSCLLFAETESGS